MEKLIAEVNKLGRFDLLELTKYCQNRAEELEREQKKAAIAQLREMIAATGLTEEEVAEYMRKGPPRKNATEEWMASLPPAARERVVGFKTKKGTSYANPEDHDQVWRGVGRPPQWLLKQIAAGRNPDTMLAA